MVRRIWNGMAQKGQAALRERFPSAFGFIAPKPHHVQLADYDERTVQQDLKKHLFELGMWSHNPDDPDKKPKHPVSEIEKAWNAVDAVWGDQVRRASKNGDPRYPEPVMNHFAYVGKQAVERLTYRDEVGKLHLLKDLHPREFQTVVALTIYHDSHEDDRKHPDHSRRGLFPKERYAQIHHGGEMSIDVPRLTRNIMLISNEREGVPVPTEQYYREVKGAPDWMVPFAKTLDGQHNVVTLGGLNYKEPNNPAVVFDKRQRYISSREAVAMGVQSMSLTLMAEGQDSGIEQRPGQGDDEHFAPWKVLHRASNMLKDVCRQARIKYNVPCRQVSSANGSAHPGRPFKDSTFTGAITK